MRLQQITALVLAAHLTCGLGPACAQQVINIGQAGNDGTGDSLRAAFGKVNSNFGLMLLKTNNLGDLPNPSTARINLGLGSAATQPSSAFDAAGAAASAVGALGSASAQPASAFDPSGAAAGVQATSLQRAANLSDLSSASAARVNLGLGSAATSAASAFDAAGAASAAQALGLQKASNLSDLASAPAARANLGLGSAATSAASSFDAAGAASAAQAAAQSYVLSYLASLPTCIAGSSVAPVTTGQPFQCAGLILIAK